MTSEGLRGTVLISIQKCSCVYNGLLLRWLLIDFPESITQGEGHTLLLVVNISFYIFHFSEVQVFALIILKLHCSSLKVLTSVLTHYFSSRVAHFYATVMLKTNTFPIFPHFCFGFIWRSPGIRGKHQRTCPVSSEKIRGNICNWKPELASLGWLTIL